MDSALFRSILEAMNFSMIPPVIEPLRRLNKETTDKGQIQTLEVREDDSWKAVPFRKDEWETSWYVRDSKGARHINQRYV